MNVEKIVREYIAKLVHMSLATCQGDTPWVCEVHYAFDSSLNLYFVSNVSTRHCQEIAANPKVAGNIIKTHQVGEPVEGVYFEGTAKRLSAGAEMDTAITSLKSHLNATAEHLAGLKNPGNDHQIYKITVKNWYIFGKFGGPSGKKYQLAWDGAAAVPA